MKPHPEAFLTKLLEKHQSTLPFPPTSEIKKLFTQLLLTLFPEQSQRRAKHLEELRLRWESLHHGLESLLHALKVELPEAPNVLAQRFMDRVPEVYELLQGDVKAMVDGDPAAQSSYEVVRAYPGFYALAFYRMAHALHQSHIPLVPRILTEWAHSRTGIDIHPAAQIGPNFFMDHGTGIVIGETTVIGAGVKLYQGVTLGALSVHKDLAQKKRHPSIEDGVVIYSGATILGGDTVVGAHSVIGGNVWLTHSVPPHTKIYHQEQVKISHE